MAFKFVTREPIVEKQIIIEQRVPCSFWNKYDQNINLFNIYENQTCFLTLSGPSFLEQLNSEIEIGGKIKTGREWLNMPGVITMGVNNSPKTFRPNLWVIGDDVKSFMRSIWLDPKIKKFIPKPKYKHTIFNNDTFEEMKVRVSECPNVIGFERDEHFDPETYLKTETVNWGEHSDSVCALGIKSKRSVMLLAMRILHTLGFKEVYLLGCDFKMDENYKYSFEQDRAKGSITNNNKIYDALQKRFSSLKENFAKTDFKVYNCNKESSLTAFDYKSFEEGIKKVINNFPDTETENSEGLYDRKANEKRISIVAKQNNNMKKGIGIHSKIFEKNHYHLNSDIIDNNEFFLLESTKKQNDFIWTLNLHDKNFNNSGVLETGFWWNAVHIEPLNLYENSILTTEEGLQFIDSFNPRYDFIKLFNRSTKPKSKYKQSQEQIEWSGVVFAAQNPYDRSVKGTSGGRNYENNDGVKNWFEFFEKSCRYYGKELLVKLHPLHKDGRYGQKEIEKIAIKYGCTVAHTDHTCLEKCDHVVLCCSTFAIDCMMRGIKVKQGTPGYFYKTKAVTYCDMEPSIKCKDTVEEGYKLCNFLASKYCFNSKQPIEWYKEILREYSTSKELFPLPEEYSYSAYLEKFVNP